MHFAKVLDEVTRFLDGHGIRFAVVGAFALQTYGLSRATSDLDFVVEDRAQGPLRAHLESLGYETIHISSGYSNHVHSLASLGRLDFIYIDVATASQLFSAATSVELLPGHTARVPRPEHLAAMKVLAMKNDPARTYQEMADIQFILGLPGVDHEEIRGYFEAQGLLERFLEIKRAASTT
jgi:hypothetical protein